MVDVQNTFVLFFFLLNQVLFIFSLTQPTLFVFSGHCHHHHAVTFGLN